MSSYVGSRPATWIPVPENSVLKALPFIDRFFVIFECNATPDEYRQLELELRGDMAAAMEGTVEERKLAIKFQLDTWKSMPRRSPSTAYTELMDFKGR